MELASLALLIVAGIILIWLMFKILKTPIKLALKLLFNAILGFIALFLINFFGDPIGLSLGMNWLNAVIIGVLGVPGALILIVLSFIA